MRATNVAQKDHWYLGAVTWVPTLHIIVLRTLDSGYTFPKRFYLVSLIWMTDEYVSCININHGHFLHQKQISPQVPDSHDHAIIIEACIWRINIA